MTVTLRVQQTIFHRNSKMWDPETGQPERKERDSQDDSEEKSGRMAKYQVLYRSKQEGQRIQEWYYQEKKKWEPNDEAVSHTDTILIMKTKNQYSIMYDQNC